MESLAANWIANYSYPAVFLLLLACGFGAPFSEEVITVLGGAIAGRAGHSIFGMLIVTYLGQIAGDMSLFFIGRKLGEKALQRRAFKKLFTPRRMAWLKQHFEHRGLATIFFVRFIPGLRAAAFLTAGTSRQPTAQFLLADALAALITAGTLTWLGHRFGESVLTQLKIATHWVALGGVALLAAIALGSVLKSHIHRSQPA